MQNLCVDKVPSPDPNQNQLSSGPSQVQRSEKNENKTRHVKLKGKYWAYSHIVIFQTENCW